MARARWIRADACAQNDDAQERDRTVFQIHDDSDEIRSRSHESRAGRRRSNNGETRPSDAQVPVLRGAHAHHCESNCPDGFSEGKIDEVFSLVALRRALSLLLEVFLGVGAVLQCRWDAHPAGSSFWCRNCTFVAAEEFEYNQDHAFLVSGVHHMTLRLRFFLSGEDEAYTFNALQKQGKPDQFDANVSDAYVRSVNAAESLL